MRPESGCRHPAASSSQSVPGAQRQRELGPGARPLTQTRPKFRTLAPRGSGLPLQLHDVEPALAGLQGVHDAEHAAADDHHAFHRQLPSVRPRSQSTAPA